MTKVELPGAPNFSKYLEDILGNRITAEGPEVTDMCEREEEDAGVTFTSEDYEDPQKLQKKYLERERLRKTYEERIKFARVIKECRSWVVKVDQKELSAWESLSGFLGIYSAYNPLQRETDFPRSYRGFVPNKNGGRIWALNNIVTLTYSRGYFLKNFVDRSLMLRRLDENLHIPLP